MAARRLSSTIRRGTAPKNSKAARCNRTQVSIVWSKTSSAYWWRLNDSVITNTHARRTRSLSRSAPPPAPHPVRLGIEQLPGKPEIDLRLVAGRHLEPDGGAVAGRAQPAQEALDGRVAAGEAVLIHQDLPDRLALHAALAQRLDLL